MQKNKDFRKKRVRKKISGSSERPRFCVSKSLKNLYVQVVDDSCGRSLVQVNSLSKDVVEKTPKDESNLAKSKMLGIYVAEKILALGIKKVVFDRSGYPYHGHIKAVAEGAREKGLEF